MDEDTEIVNNVIDTFSYQGTSFTKKELGVYLKGYFKKVKKHLKKNNPDRVEKFMEGAKTFAGWLIKNFDEIEL